MALEEIFRALEEQADQEFEQTLDDARMQSAAILEEADEEAEKIRGLRAADGERRATNHAQQLVNAVRLEGKKRVASAKERAVNDVFEAVKDVLAQARGAAEYSEQFRTLAEEATAGLEGELTVHVDPADADLAKRVFDELGLVASIEPTLSTAGGLVVTTHGGRILRRNTYEDRLEKVRQLVQANVAEILFS
jgi:vacuolar-type H+-ATPase subunit E/Vma4